MLSSRLPKTKKFKIWITNEVLPSIRKYGYYKMTNKYKTKIKNIMKKIDFLEKQNKLMKNELKKDKFPKGALIYVIDYSNDKNNIYRIGKLMILIKELKYMILIYCIKKMSF